MLRDSEEIKRLLKALRAEKGLNGNEMSKRLNLSPGTYNKKENHPDLFTFASIKELATAFEVDTKRIMNIFFTK